MQRPSCQVGKGRLALTELLSLAHGSVGNLGWQRSPRRRIYPWCKGPGGNSATQPVKGRLGPAGLVRSGAAYDPGWHCPGWQRSLGRRSEQRGLRRVGSSAMRAGTWTSRRRSSRRRSPVAPHIYVSEITPSKPAARRDGVGGGHKPRLGRDVAARRRVPSSAQGLQLPTQTLRHLASWVTRPLRGEKFGPKDQATGR